MQAARENMDEQLEQHLIELVEFIEEVKDYKLKKKRLFAYDIMQQQLRSYAYLREYVRLLKEEKISTGKNLEKAE